MNTSGKRSGWQWRRQFVCLVLGLLVAACDTPKGQQENLPENAMQQPEAAEDTTQLHVPPDSTLHKVQEVSIRITGDALDKIRYSHDSILVEAGALVKLKLKNEGTEQSMIHNIVITREGQYRQVALAGAKAGSPSNYLPEQDSAVIAASALALPGQTVELEFQAPLQSATYDFVCTYPEHYKAKHGKLIVK